MPIYWTEEDLPEGLRRIIEEPCQFCHVSGIHDCRYDETKILERLIDKHIERPGSPDLPTDSDSALVSEDLEHAMYIPDLGFFCVECEMDCQTVDGICIDCTNKRRVKRRLAPLVIKDNDGKEVFRQYPVGD